MGIVEAKVQKGSRRGLDPSAVRGWRGRHGQFRVDQRQHIKLRQTCIIELGLLNVPSAKEALWSSSPGWKWSTRSCASILLPSSHQGCLHFVCCMTWEKFWAPRGSHSIYFRPSSTVAAIIRRTTADTSTKPKTFLDFHFLLTSLLIYECFFTFFAHINARTSS